MSKKGNMLKRGTDGNNSQNELQANSASLEPRSCFQLNVRFLFGF